MKLLILVALGLLVPVAIPGPLIVVADLPEPIAGFTMWPIAIFLEPGATQHTWMHELGHWRYGSQHMVLSASWEQELAVEQWACQLLGEPFQPGEQPTTGWGSMIPAIQQQGLADKLEALRQAWWALTKTNGDSR